MNNNNFITNCYTNNIDNPSNRIVEQAYTPKKPQFLERHVTWICKTDRPTTKKIFVAALVIFEMIVLALSIVGIPTLVNAVAIRNKTKDMEQFQKKVDDGNLNPPSLKFIPLISKTATSNVANYYAINDDTLWYKPIRDKDADWKPIYFDGFSNKRKPIEIQVDGANLIILDDKNQVHYKKVINEFRDKEDGHYVYLDKSVKNNWKDRWYSFPILNVIANLFTGKLLKLPENTKAWAISQRRILNNYLEDGKGAKHEAVIGVTTFYALQEDGKTVKVYDPWVCKNSDIAFYMPETSTSSFKAENIAAGASTLAAIGYETTRSENGNGTNKKLKIYTQLADIDSVGWDPGIQCQYPCELPDDEKITVPFAKWIDHPLLLEGEAAVTKDIRVIQTGQGNDARVILVEGQNKDGQSGYFHKKITDKEWSFQENDHEVVSILSKEYQLDESFQPMAHNYSGIATNKGKEIEGISIKIKDHGDHNYVSTIELTAEGKTVNLIYNKRKTLKNFIGFKKHTHEIAFPHNDEINDELKPYLEKIFGDKKIVRISRKESENFLKIRIGKGIQIEAEIEA